MFSKEKFDIEKNVLVEEYSAGMDNPDTYFISRSHEEVYGNVMHWVVGSEKSIKKFTVEQ